MANRRERVTLELEDNFSGPLARATASTMLFKKALNDLDGNAVKVDRALKETTKSGSSSAREFERSGRSIDQFSGRLSLAAQALATIGPAAVPIGAVAIPAIAGLASQMGFAAIGAGVLIGSFQGVGDALDSLNKAQLEPTAENLQAAREQMDGLAPQTQAFVRQIQALVPQLKQVRDAGAAGIFSGFGEGIDSLERRLPLLERLAAGVGDAIGNLGSDAGASLASGRWGPFLRFLEDEAPDAISNLGHVIGDLAHGAAELWMAFDPLNDDVVGALQRGADAFDRWASGLSETQGFREFVDYVRESGPIVAQALESVASAAISITTAVAPIGQDALKVLTVFADVVDRIASSDFGAPIATAAAALVVFNRAAAVTASLAPTLGAGGAAAGAAGATGSGAGIFAAAGLGFVTDSMSIHDSNNRSEEAAAAYSKTMDDLAKNLASSNVGKYANDLDIDMQRLTEDLALNGKKGEYVTEVQKKLADSGHGVGAMFNSQIGAMVPFYTSSADKAYDAGHDLNDILGNLADTGPLSAAGMDAAGDSASELADFLFGVVPAADEAAAATERFSNALAQMAGFLDRRAALRGYRDDLKELQKGLKDGFGRKDVENIDAAAKSIINVAQGIKSKGAREDFLAGARQSLSDLATKSGPKAQAEIAKIIGKLDEYGLTKPPAPKLDADDKPAKNKLNSTQRLIDGLTGKTVPVGVDAGRSYQVIDGVQYRLDNLKNKTVFITTVNRTVGAGGQRGGRAIPLSADGGSVPKDSGPYVDKHLYMLAPGEEIISNRHGQADRFRSDRASGRIPGYADGGTTGKKRGSRDVVNVTGFTDGRRDMSIPDALRGLRHELADTQRAFNKSSSAADRASEAADREVSARDNVIASMASLASDIANQFDSNLFEPLNNVWGSNRTTSDPISVLMGDITNSEQFSSLFAGLQGRGLSGGALTAAARGGVAGLQTVGAYSDADLARYADLYAQREASRTSTGQEVALAQYGQSLKEANNLAAASLAAQDQANAELRDIKAQLGNQTAAVKNVEAATKDNGRATASGRRGRVRRG